MKKVGEIPENTITIYVYVDADKEEALKDKLGEILGNLELVNMDGINGWEILD